MPAASARRLAPVKAAAPPDKRDAILRAAIKVFARHGYFQSQVADVARLLETSVPTARRRFTRAHRYVSRLARGEPSLARYVEGSIRGDGEIARRSRTPFRVQGVSSADVPPAHVPRCSPRS